MQSVFKPHALHIQWLQTFAIPMASACIQHRVGLVLDIYLKGDAHVWEDVYLSCDHQARHAPTHNMAMSQDMHTLILCIRIKTAALWRGLATVLMDDFIPTALHI